MYDASEMVSSIHSLVKFRSQEAHVFRDVPRVFLDCATGVMLCVYTYCCKSQKVVVREEREATRATWKRGAGTDFFVSP